MSHHRFTKRGKVKSRKFARMEEGAEQGGTVPAEDEVAQGGQDAEKHDYPSKKEVRKQGVFSTNAIIGRGSPNKSIGKPSGPAGKDRMRVKHGSR